MPVFKANDIEMSAITMDGVEQMQGNNVIGAPEGWDSHAMRLFRLLPGGHAPPE